MSEVPLHLNSPRAGPGGPALALPPPVPFSPGKQKAKSTQTVTSKVSTGASKSLYPTCPRTVAFSPFRASTSLPKRPLHFIPAPGDEFPSQLRVG